MYTLSKKGNHQCWNTIAKPTGGSSRTTVMDDSRHVLKEPFVRTVIDV